MKKLVAITILCVMLFTGTSWSAQPEDALSTQYEDAVYMVLRLEDTSRLLKWVFSSENLKLFMPLILKGKSEVEVLAAAEFINAMVSMTPVRSAALVVGMSKRDIKNMMPVMQIAFTVSPEVSSIVKKIADGHAEALDVATLLLGSRIAATFAETMIKVEREKDNIFRVNNAVFMTASDDLVIFGSSVNHVRSSLKALSDEKSRLFTAKTRKFSEKDYAFMHMDYETLAALDDDKDLEAVDARKYFDKPLELEFAFERLADKFLMSSAFNFREAIKKEYADKIQAQFDTLKPIKGGNINLANSGSKGNPLLALGGYLNFDAMRENEAAKPFVDAALRNLRVRFGISEEEATGLLNGSFSAIVNGNVTFEGMKIPALYISQTGKEGAAEKVFSKLTKSQHFSKVHDGILQLDSSLSPISCLAADKGESLGIYFAELASLTDQPSVKSGLSELLERESISSIWIDFAEIQSWINNDENGVLLMLGPLMAFGGYGDYFKALRDVLNAELSVPSMSFWSDNSEVFHTEFAVKDITPENGLFARLMKLYQEFSAPKSSKKGDDK